MRSPRPFVLALALLALARCTPLAPQRPAPPPAGPDPALQALFDPHPADDGPAWLGGDVASSAPLDDARVVWLFGDTLLGSVDDDCPPPARYCDRDVLEDEADGMISSSLAIMRRAPDGSLLPMEPYWPRAHGRALPVLPSLRAGEFLWPMSVARVGGTLLVSASRHTREMGLASLGSVLLRVVNAAEAPAAWRWEAARVTASHPPGDGRPQLTWMTALVPHGDWVYVLGQRAAGLLSETLLARFPARDVARPTWAPALEFLERPGERWATVYDPLRAHVVEGLPGTTEASVHHDDRLGWYSFRILPLTFDVRLYTARALAGPWQDRGVVYRLPPEWSEPTRPDGLPRYAAYAVKAHPWIGDGSDVVLTYNVNLLDGSYESAAAAAEREDAFYVPRVIRVAPWPR